MASSGAAGSRALAARDNREGEAFLGVASTALQRLELARDARRSAPLMRSPPSGCVGAWCQSWRL
eukprot:4595714-Pyramimonas_sp.AAC.1